MKKLKIGICCYPSHGGSGVVATELGIKLAQIGHEIHFISYDKPFRLGEYNANIFYHNVDVVNYPVFQHPPYIMALANKIYEVYERENLDIVHAHYAVPHSLAVYLAKAMSYGKLKTVTTLHGTDVTIMGEEPSLIEISKFSIAQSDAITAVSDSLAQSAKNLLGESKHINMIYNFVDTNIYERKSTCDIRQFLNIDKDEKIIIHISNFRKVKRIHDVIKIFEGINKATSGCLLLVGDGPEQRSAYDLAKNLGLDKKIHFLGNQDSVVSLLSNADLFLLPSEMESFGLSALEAMACEVPVVATNVGGLPELIDHGVTGFVSDVGDVDDMIFNSVKILMDPKVRSEMALNSRIRVLENFDSDLIVREYEELYFNLLGGK